MIRVAVTVAGLSLLFAQASVSAQQPKTRTQKEMEEHLKTLKSNAKTPDRVRAITRIVELEAIRKGTSKDAIPTIAKALGDKEVLVRAAAAEAIGTFAASGYDVKEYVDDLVALVSDTQKREVKISAIIALGHVGKDAAPAVKLLTDLLEKEKAKDDKMRDREMFQMLNEALQRLRAAGVSSLLVPDPRMRLAALHAMRPS
jgi:HEAT repeat protein